MLRITGCHALGYTSYYRAELENARSVATEALGISTLEIETQIAKLHILRGPLVRRSLKLFNIKLDDQAERMAWLAHFLPRLQGNGIIYTLTIQQYFPMQ